ncbi:MAG TPA: HAMP domain-containing sensor histidine kinase [Candidatus Angelobacter sp.]|jgi:signal transduction histidine kinase|nr:HAMP domain-containing sensor histidine kinase [Candidatus Angelobacter sp.]
MKRPVWNVRTKLLLTLGLVVLPAAALIFFGLEHLQSLERSHSVEAAIQGDFQKTLTIFDKRLSERAYDMMEDVRIAFPTPSDEHVDQRLDKILANHPWALYAFLFDKENGTIVRVQPSKHSSAACQAGAASLHTMIQGWFELEGEMLLAKMARLQHVGEQPYLASAEQVTKGDRQVYQSVIFFPVAAGSQPATAIGGIMFDPDFLEQFLPASLNDLLAENGSEAGHDTHPQPAVMLHFVRDHAPIAVSRGWDGGEAEVERKMEGAFPDLVMAIRYPGTTIKAINQRFLRTSYIILGTLSLLLVTGLFFTYRSVTKTMELAKLKSDIVSNVSHELRTPLALIRLYAETLELGRIPDEQRKLEYYRIVRKESERLTALINNILDFSRIEAGRKDYDFRETDLPSLVRETLDSYHYQIQQSGFRYEEQISSDLPPVNVDREAIARSLLNLVNNALKYSGEEKYLAVNLYREDGCAKLDVIDHGIGIPRGEQNRIFDKFYRVCDPLCHDNKGSGLGLALVEHIVSAHGGKITVESSPGKGSKFTIALPLKQQPATAGTSSLPANPRTHEVGA